MIPSGSPSIQSQAVLVLGGSLQEYAEVLQVFDSNKEASGEVPGIERRRILTRTKLLDSRRLEETCHVR